MELLLAILVVSALVVSALVVIYLIRSEGGIAISKVAIAATTDGPDGYVLRPPQSADIEQIIAISGEPRAMTAQGWDQKTLEFFAERLRSSPKRIVHNVVVVAEAAEGDVAGCTTVSLRNESDEDFSIGLHVAEVHLGHGIGTHLMRLTISALQQLPQNMWVGTATTNVGVQRIMERLGYSPEPGIEPYQAPSGEIFDSLWYKVGAGSRPPR